jgi:hypothetical protein
MRRFLPPLLALFALSGCVTPMAPQVASSPVAYAYPGSRTGKAAEAPVSATPVAALPGQTAALPGQAAAAPRVDEQARRTIVAQPVVVVTPSYRLPSDVVFPN